MKILHFVVILGSVLSSHAQTVVVQTEGNDSIGTATPTGITAGSALGVLSIGNNGDGPHGPTSGDGTGDFDFFSLAANAGQVISVDVNAIVNGSAMDSVVAIYDSTGGVLVFNDDSDGIQDSRTTYTVATAGTYYIAVGSFVAGGTAATNMPTDATTPGTGPGPPAGGIGDYEVVIGLDLPKYLTRNLVTFPAALLANDTGQGSLTLTNRGSSSTTITAINKSGAHAANFIFTETFPIVISAGGSHTVNITFTPDGSTEVQTTMLEIVSDDVIHPTLDVPLTARAYAQGLMLRLSFDDPPGSPIGSLAAPLDSSGNGWLAAFVNNNSDPVLGRPPLAGGSGTSVMFSDTGGTGSYALTSNDSPHVPTFTYSLWIRPTVGAGVDTLLNRDPNYGFSDAVYGLNIETNGALTFKVSGTQVCASAPGAIVDDQTYHIVVTHLDSTGFGDYFADRTRLYINGALVSDSDVSLGYTFDVPEYFDGAANRRLWIATRSAAGTGFNGDMDDLQLYNTELCADQVAKLFSNPGSVIHAPFIITSVTRNISADVTVTWNSQPMKTYAVYYSGDLINWTKLTGGIASTDCTTSHTELATPGTKRFYQVREE